MGCTWSFVILQTKPLQMFWYYLLLSLSVRAFSVDTVAVDCEIEILW